MSKVIAPALCALVLAACSPKSADTAAPAEPTPAPRAAVEQPVVQAAATRASLTRITDPSTVCMVNDQHMGTAQIPVQVEGKTYYGCCQMCEARLNQDAQVRLGRDPVTKRSVDKASAVLAKDASGKILYFESEDTFGSYVAQR